MTQNDVLVRELTALVPGCQVHPSSRHLEALGAALWAQGRETRPVPPPDGLFDHGPSRFGRLPPLSAHEGAVTFGRMERAAPTPSGEYLLGIDVGSTTTKAVLMRRGDLGIVASCYLRTHGDPVGAARRCYDDLLRQVGDDLSVVAMGVTGSGRHIVGLHGLTDGIVNEIAAHAAAAAHFDPEVDTIFEIGGQDAKYTYLVNGVPCDYAMNEACSAGTGSFLEESAQETLGVPLDQLADLALAASSPADFSDQCAAFIASDLKHALHEGIGLPDMVAGLVYSVCVNYTNKVRSNRPVGGKVFMQGGVCYNRAVPVAMAALCGKPIVVPPEPGLMGAFGVALEMHKRLELGLSPSGAYRLSALARREVQYGTSFSCAGGPSRCDLGCEVQMTVIDGKRFPFGGRCDRYFNRRVGRRVETGTLDLVRERNRLVFETHAYTPLPGGGRVRVGMNRSFLIHTYLPFFSHFFGEMGLELVLPDRVLSEGMDRKGSSYCFPAELAHGFYQDLLAKAPEHIVLAQISELPVPGREPTEREQQSLCVTAQAEPYTLESAFRGVAGSSRVHRVVLNFWRGIAAERGALLSLAAELGVPRRRAARAFGIALEQQRACEEAMRAAGARVLEELEREPGRHAIVLFGRAYSAFAGEANMGIPHKFASRGVSVLPMDILDLAQGASEPWMHWATGHAVQRASQIVARHPQLYGAYVTNFSCGPDSFLVGWFREAMGAKASLTLEIDNHTADAGINTRIDAFLDVVREQRVTGRARPREEEASAFVPARVETGRRAGAASQVVTESSRLALTDPRVHVLVPPMGDLGSQAIASVLRRLGIRATESPTPTPRTLQVGRGCTTCKECLPLTLCAGSLLEHVQGRPADEVTIYFMPRAEGNCRFGQYAPFLESLVRKHRLPRVGLLTISSQDHYAGLGMAFARRALYGVLLSDAMRDIRNAVRTLAADPQQGMAVFAREWGRIRRALETESEKGIERAAGLAAAGLARIPLRRTYAEAKQVLLVGEIYLRTDEFGCNHLAERLAERGLLMRTAPVYEWLRYVEWLVASELAGAISKTVGDRLRALVVKGFEVSRERRIKQIMRASGLYEEEMLDLPQIIEAGRRFVDPRLTGETILVTGVALREILHRVCGVVSIGPFACLPSRLCEALLGKDLTVENRRAYAAADVPGGLAPGGLPVLSIEADGRPFPPLVEARLEAFMLQADRLGERMMASSR